MELKLRRSWLALRVGVFASMGLFVAIAAATWPARLIFGFAVALAGASYGYSKVRNLRLVLDEAGVTGVRQGYRIHAAWDDIVGIETRPRKLIIPAVKFFAISAATLTDVAGDALPQTAEDRIRGTNAVNTIEVGIYDDLRPDGPVGRMLAAHRPDLVTGP